MITTSQHRPSNDRPASLRNMWSRARAVALAFLSGVLVVLTAIGGILRNMTIRLSGIGALNLDGRFAVTEVLFILAWRVVGLIGGRRLLAGVLNTMWHALWPAEPAPALQPVRPSRLRRRR